MLFWRRPLSSPELLEALAEYLKLDHNMESMLLGVNVAMGLWPPEFQAALPKLNMD